MKHQMKLQERFFNYMKNGTKRIELRLYDEKRSIINLGDEIEFSKLPDLFKDFDISVLADKSMTKKELLDVLEEFYTPGEQNKYGVLGIRIEKI